MGRRCYEVKMSRKVRARLAWATSFLKRRWDFDDYPLDFVDQGECDPNLPERLQHTRWRADLINWFAVSGVGETTEAALADAKQKFAALKASGERMWRPGTGPGVVFPENQAIDRLPELRDHFIRKVLGLDWAWVTDASSLWDFHTRANNDEMHLKIGEVYGVDVSDIEGANLLAILERVMDEIGTFPEDPSVRAVRLSRDSRGRHILGLPEQPWNQYSPSSPSQL